MTINTEDFLYPPEDIQDLTAPDAAQKIQTTFELIFSQLRKLQTSADTPATHDILSTTHPDTTVQVAANGDLIIRSGGTWRRLPAGTNGHFLQLAAGLPAWGVDGSLLQGLEHNVLSARHSDSDPASPVLGDLIVALDVGSVEHSKYWVGGESCDIMPTANSQGGQQYWLAGEASDAIVSSGVVKWQRKAIGAAGTVPVSDGSRWDWTNLGTASGSVGASAYRSSDLLLNDLTETVVDLSAEHFDDGGFWTAAAPSRMTVPANQSGLYVVNAIAAFAVAFGSGHAQLLLKVNGTEVARNSAAATNTATLEGGGGVTWIGKLNVGDYVELFAVIEWGGLSHLIKGGSDKTFLQIAKV